MRKLISSNIEELTATLLEAAKKHLRVTHSKEDDLIKDKLAAAILQYETYTSISLTNSTYKMGLDNLPANGIIDILPAPLCQIIGVSYYDKDNNRIELDETEYTIDDFSTPARLQLPIVETYKRLNAIQIEYSTGGKNINANAKAAIMLLTGHYYVNREEVITGLSVCKVPYAAENLMNLERINNY